MQSTSSCDRADRGSPSFWGVDPRSQFNGETLPIEGTLLLKGEGDVRCELSRDEEPSMLILAAWWLRSRSCNYRPSSDSRAPLCGCASDPGRATLRKRTKCSAGRGVGEAGARCQRCVRLRCVLNAAMHLAGSRGGACFGIPSVSQAASSRGFPREVIARGGSRRRSSTDSRGGLRDLECGSSSYELVALSQKLKRLGGVVCQAPGSAKRSSRAAHRRTTSTQAVPRAAAESCCLGTPQTAKGCPSGAAAKNA